MTQNFKGIVRLSNENYLTLSTTGTLTLKDGSTLTFDPTSTLYITPDPTIDFTQEDKDKVEIIDISGDGTQFLSNDGSYKTIESGIETLIGTEEKPINFATDMEIGKLYSVSGLVFRATTLTPRNITAPLLIFKDTASRVTIHNGNLSRSYYGQNPGQRGWLNINAETGEFSSSSQQVGYNEYNLPGTINGQGGGGNNIWAPITVGTAGQILQSKGQGAPTWIDLPESGIPTLIGTEEKPVNLATDLKISQIYTISGKVIRNETLFYTVTSNRLVYKKSETEVYFLNTYAFGSHLQDDITCDSMVTIDASTGYPLSQQRTWKFTSVNAKSTNAIPSGIYAPTTGGTQGQILQSNGNNEPTWIDLPDALPQLNGTEDTPINLYNDLEVNKLYSISGVIYNSDNNLTANDSILTYKTNTNSLYLIGGKIDLLTNELSFQPNYFTVAEVEATGEISTHQSSIAPVNSGTSGQVLTSNGPDQEPTWKDISTPSTPNTSALTADGAELNFNAGDSTGTAHLVCNQNLYIGEETKDLSLDCDTFQLFTQDGWNWESTIANENEDDDTARFSFQMGNITLSNSNQGVHLNKAADQIVLQASSVRGNTSTADLGTSALPWNNIYGKTIYQNGQQVATKAEAALYKHNVSINGSNDSGQQINARVVGLNRSNVLVTTYGQLINMITGAVDYPLSGYVYNEDNTFLGTILYFDYNMGNYFEFTVATSTGIEVIQLTTAQATISDTVAVVE